MHVLFLFCIACMFFNTQAYQIRMLQGSFMKKEMYMPLLKELKIGQQPIVFQEYLDFSTYDQECILIGHSFGGFFALLHGLWNPHYVKAIILINSHFNHRYQMPYFAIPLSDVKQPVLTIYTTHDEQLPPEKVEIDEEKALQIPYTNKKFICFEGDHFSLWNNPLSRRYVVYEIKQFLMSSHVSFSE
jgi:hypothetical protein